MSDNALITIDTASFGSQIEQLRRVTGKSARSIVRFWARKAVGQVAWATAISPAGFAARGRARAGWWPAASAIGASTVYTLAPNLNEGSVIDNSLSESNPSFTMINLVPYVTHIPGIVGAVGNAINGLEAWAKSQAEGTLRQAWSTVGTA